ncbi:ABC transporter ATP-binding protein [Paenibacillus faecalis]|uniref:ABC transporter ATP-binding protein n=1 Tax=Paenibacillus faecalis TaxID=2079532 RepID=UPI000D107EAF|nr:ABC transporter ATP-binding protein [Paenibacillus faecalis]
MIKVDGLVKKYNEKTAVAGITLSIEKGELFGLLGPNGAGKSTTISMLAGLVKPTSGSIHINGADISKHPIEGKKRIGLVPQEIALYPTLSAVDNLRFWGRMYGVTGKRLKERVTEVLRIVNLEDRKNQIIKSYSGGMQRRINIAAALIHEPEILIMDEPTVGIDPQSRNYILETVKELNGAGITVIYTSHYMEEVEFLCTKIAIVDDGKIIAMDDKENLKKTMLDGEVIDIRLSEISPELVKSLHGLEAVRHIQQNDYDLSLSVNDADQALTDILTVISGHQARIVQMKVEEPNLESVFLKLTGKALRD